MCKRYIFTIIVQTQIHFIEGQQKKLFVNNTKKFEIRTNCARGASPGGNEIIYKRRNSTTDMTLC